MEITTTALVALALNSFLATSLTGRPLPHPGDQLDFNLKTQIQQKAKTCEAAFALKLEAKLENRESLVVTSTTTQTAGPSGCGKPSNAIKAWHYRSIDNALTMVTECKTLDPSTCASRDPLPEDQWQSPETQEACKFVGTEPLLGPDGKLNTHRYRCDNSASVGGVALTDFWLDESYYPAYPIIKTSAQIEIPKYEVKMHVEQVLKAIKRN
ncbi:hypothetical protein WDW86_00885 [Bdellovibrionota bacterium FG-2]